MAIPHRDATPLPLLFLLNNSEDAVFAYNIVLLVADLDFIGTVFGKHHLLPLLDGHRDKFPFIISFAGPTSIILPWSGFSLSTVSGMKIPDLVFEPLSSSENGSIKTLLCNGFMFFIGIK